MAKILLVEDDNNLREIYEARLQAEGYDIVAARDGEEALTVAMKERPDLIISDVMMPKISGFDMLDIIRSTEETKDVKVIMMTALSQAEDKARADKLGADRYLVKSQVTLEDVAKVAREVLNGTSSPRPQSSSSQDIPVPAAAAPAPMPQPVAQTASAVPVPAALPVAPVPAADPAQQAAPLDQTSVQSSAAQAIAAVSPTTPLSDDAQTLSQPTDQEQADITAQIDSFIDSTRPAPATDAETVDEPQEPVTTQAPLEIHEETSGDSSTEASQPQRVGKKVIQPLNDLKSSKGPDLNKLLEKEQERDQMASIAQDIASKNVERVENTESTPAQTESKPEVDDESVAEEALRVAAQHKTESLVPGNSPMPNAPEDNSELPHAPEVAISEDGNLHLASVPEAQTPLSEDTTPSAMNFEPAPVPEVDSSLPTDESRLAEAAAQLNESVQQAEPQPQPNIPHTNGTSIDGVSTPGILPNSSSAQTVPTQITPPLQSPSTEPQGPSSGSPDDISL